MEKIIEDIVPTEFELAQNYPNPFKENTTIKFCVPQKISLRLEVFDSNGNKVKTLVDEIKEAGTHKVEFDSQEFGSGEYHYKLETDNYCNTKKMITIK